MKQRISALKGPYCSSRGRRERKAATRPTAEQLEVIVADASTSCRLVNATVMVTLCGRSPAQTGTVMFRSVPANVPLAVDVQCKCYFTKISVETSFEDDNKLQLAYGNSTN